jgi:hypothetical protein
MSQFSLKVAQEDIQGAEQFVASQQNAVNFFRLNGYLHIEDAIPEDLIDAVRDSLINGISMNEDKTQIAGGFEVGPRRFMVPVKIAGKFNDSSLFANPALLSLMPALLGQDFVIDSFGAVVSLPGADKQHIHRDSPPIYGEHPFLETSLPPYAVTVTIPLVDVTMVNGPTLFMEGSHMISMGQPGLPSTEQAICCKKGSIVIWDYRILHGGAANKSTEVRPLLYLVYARPWFQDHVNFSDDVRPIDIDQETFRAFPDMHKKLFRRSIEAMW